MAHKEFTIGLDNRPFLKKLIETDKAFDKLQRKIVGGQGVSRLPDTFGLANREAQGLNLSMNKMAGIIGATFGVTTISQFAQKVAHTRGEFQQLEISLETMLGSKVKANKLMSQLVESATKTPLSLQSMAGGAKQLLAYGEKVENVNSRLLKLGDIATGLNIPLGDLVYLYGTTMVQGRMYTRDMIQFMGRGITLAEELAKQFGVTKDKVGELVTAGKVGAKEFEQAIDSIATGKFNGLMEKQSKSITGQLSNLGDSIDVMFNNIGKSTEDVISGSIGAVDTLVENYEKLGKVLATLVATYGTFKTAMYVANVTKGLNLAEGIMYMGMLGKETVTTSKAVGMLNKVMKSNPYVLLVTGLVSLGTYLVAFADHTDEATKAQERLNSVMKQSKDYSESLDRANRRSIDIILDKTESLYAQHRAYEQLIRDNQMLAKYSIEDLQNMSPDKRAKLLNQAKDKAEVEGYYKPSRDKYITATLLKAEEDGVDKLKEKMKLFSQTYRISLNEIQDIYNRYRADVKAEIDDKADEWTTFQDGAFEEVQHKYIKLYNTGKEEAEKELSNREEFRKEQDRTIEEKIAREQKAVDSFSANIKRTQEDLQALERTKSKLEKDGDTHTTINGKAVISLDYERTLKDIDKAQKDLEHYYKTRSEYQKRLNQLNKKKNKKTDVSETKSSLEAQKKKLEEDIASLHYQKDKAKRDKAIENLRKVEKKLEWYSTKESKKSKAYDPSKDKEALKHYTDEMLEAHTQSVLELEQAKELANAKGYEREQLLIEHNYQRQLADIKRYEKQLLNSRIESERNKYRIAHGGSDKGFNAEGIQLSKEQTSILDNKRALAEQTLQQSKVKLFEDYLIQVESFEQKRTEVAQKYADIRKAIADNEKLSQEQRSEALARAKVNETEALNQLKEKALSKYNLLDLSKGGGSNLVEQSIKKVLPLFHDLSKLSFKELKKAKSAIKDIKIDPKTLKELEKAGVDIEELSKQLEKLKETSEEQVDTELFNDLIDKANQTANAIGRIGSALNNIQGIGGIASKLQGLGSMLSNLSQAGSEISGALKAINSGNKIGGYGALLGTSLNGVVGVYNMIERQQQENIKREQEWADAIRERSRVTAMLNIEQAGKRETNIFGVEDPLARAKAGAKQYKQAILEANKVAQQFNKHGLLQGGLQTTVSGKNVLTGIGLGASAGAAIGSIVPVIGTAIGGVVGGIVGGIAGWFGGKKKEPWYAKLQGKYKNLYDKETFELNPEIKKDYALFDDATKKMIDNWDKIKEKAKEAHEQMKKNFQDLAGDISTKLKQAVVKGFASGNMKGALKDWKQEVGNIIKDLGMQSMMNAITKPIFDKLEKDLMATEGDEAGVIGILDKFADNVPKLAERLEMGAKALDNGLKSRNYNGLGGADPRTASVKGIAQASQESISELNGLMHTSVMAQERIHKTIEGIGFDRFADIGEKVAQEVSLIRQINATIAESNANIANSNEFIRQSTSSMNNTLSEIKRVGLNIKR